MQVLNCDFSLFRIIAMVMGITAAIYLLLKRYSFVGAGFIVAGGLSNILEALKSGCVRDNINFFSISMINIADIAIVVGVLTAALELYIKPLMPKSIDDKEK